MRVHAHAAFDLAHRRCSLFAQTAPAGQICFCIGPGGAGKTTLAGLTCSTVYGAADRWPDNERPYIFVAVDVADRGYFSPKSFINRCLIATLDPFRTPPEEAAGWAVPQEIRAAVQRYAARTTRRSMSEPEMRDTFVNLAKILRVRSFVVDEANLLVLTQRGRVPTDYLESIRCLCDLVGCNLLLFGTPRLMELTRHSAQLNRRTEYVHLDRLRCDDEDSRRAFRRFLAELETDYRIPERLLIANARLVYDWTYGIAGEIVGLIQRANRYLRSTGESELQLEHLQQAKRLRPELQQMREEADLISAFMTEEPCRSPVTAIAKHSKRPGTRLPVRHKNQPGVV